MTKYSNEILWAAIEFSRAVKESVPDDDEYEQRIDAMFDAFDPSLKRQMLMYMLKGHTGGNMIIRCSSNQPSAINAIKAVRSATGFSLKDAKMAIDAARDYGTTRIEGEWSRAQARQLARELSGTGFELL